MPILLEEELGRKLLSESNGGIDFIRVSSGALSSRSVSTRFSTDLLAHDCCPLGGFESLVVQRLSHSTVSLLSTVTRKVTHLSNDRHVIHFSTFLVHSHQ